MAMGGKTWHHGLMDTYSRTAWRDAWVETKRQLFAPDFVVPFLAGMATCAVTTGLLALGLHWLLR